MSDPDDHWLDIGGEDIPGGEKTDPESYLDFCEIPVAPLDAQLGKWPLLSVPDGLSDPLFGVAHLNTYVIVHPGDFSGGVAEVEACDLPYRCLFKGRAAEERRDEAPFVIQLTPDAPFTRKLFTDHKTGFGLWGKTDAMFVTTSASLEQTSEHFRRFTRFSDTDGKWFHLRFWDGLLFSEYWKHFASSYERVAQFFYTRDFEQQFVVCLQSDSGVVRINPTIAPEPPRRAIIKPFAFDADDFAFFQARINHRIKSKVADDLRQRLASAPQPLQDNIQAAVVYCFAFIEMRSRGQPVRADDCATLSFLVLMWDSLAADILAGPVFSEPLSPIGHRIELAKMSYFESLNRMTGQGA